MLRTPELANDLAACFESSELPEGVYDPVGLEREFMQTCEKLRERKPNPA